MLEENTFEEDLPRYGALLNEIEESCNQLNGVIKDIKDKVKNGELTNHNNGLDILKIKVIIRFKIRRSNLFPSKKKFFFGIEQNLNFERKGGGIFSIDYLLNFKIA